MPTPDWNATPPDWLLRRVKARGNHLRTRRKVTALAVIAMLGITASVTAIGGGSPSRTAVLAGEGGYGPSGSEEAGSTTTSTTAGEGESATDDGNGGGGGGADEQPESTSTTSTTAAGGTSAATTTVKQTTTTSTTAGVALSVPHPREGTYRYRVTNDDANENEMRVTYEVLLRDEDEVRLRKTRPGPTTDPWGGDPVELSWQRDRVLVRNDDTCDEAPTENAATLYRFPMSVGTSWSWDSTCSNEDLGVVRRQGSAKVVERTTQEIEGRALDVWVMSAAYTIEITLRGVTRTFYGEHEERFAPELGLRTWSKSHTRQTKERTGTEGDPIMTELLHLDPA